MDSTRDIAVVVADIIIVVVVVDDSGVIAALEELSLWNSFVLRTKLFFRRQRRSADGWLVGRSVSLLAGWLSHGLLCSHESDFISIFAML